MRVFYIALNDLKRFLKDKAALFFAIILPIIFTLFMGTAFGNMTTTQKIPVGIADNDKSSLTTAMVKQVEADTTLNLTRMSEESLKENIRSQKLSVGLIIPKGFSQKAAVGEKAQIFIVKLPSSNDYLTVTQTLISKFTNEKVKDVAYELYTQKLNEKSNLTGDQFNNKFQKELKTSIVSIDEKKLIGEGLKNTNAPNAKVSFSIGFLIMFVMFSLLLGAGEILEEKKNFTWYRLISTPSSTYSIMLGKILGLFFQGGFQILILVLFGKFILGVGWGKSIFLTALLMGVFLLSIISFGIFLSTVLRTNAQVNSIVPLLVVSTSMLGGCYWPTEITPKFMQMLGKTTPQYWAIKGLDNLVVYNMGLSSIIVSLVFLTGFGVLFAMLGMFFAKESH